MTDRPSYNEMVTEAIKSLKERTGSSRQAISKYITENYEVPPRYEVHMKQALKRLVGTNAIVQTRGTGASGSFMMNKGAKKVATKTVKDSVDEERENKPTKTKSAKKVNFDAAETKKGKSARGVTKRRGAPSDEDTVSDQEVMMPKGGRGKPRKGVAKKGGDSAGEDTGDQVGTRQRRAKGESAAKGAKKGTSEKTAGKALTEKGGRDGRGRRAESMKKGDASAKNDVSDDDFEVSTKPKGKSGKGAANKGSADQAVKRNKGRGKAAKEPEDVSEDTVTDEEVGADVGGSDREEEMPQEGVSSEDPGEATDELKEDITTEGEMKKTAGPRTKRAGVKNTTRPPAKRPKK